MKLVIDESKDGLGISLGNEGGGYVPLTRKPSFSRTLKEFEITEAELLRAIQLVKGISCV